ncbi:type II toxin-antitoxin system Phd/YefM family antitoxin [Mitsuokella sp.]|uniref:type II toxin-antitoxin system Phd/YefM family antitoxin n=1 Tax=unclassified Mitsuokella TaxID=2637239 RepID=UPI003D7DB3D9
MQIMNATTFRKNIYQTLSQTVEYNEPVCITGKQGNAILLSEEDYRDMLATLELSTNPAMQKKIVDGLNTPLTECLDEDAVKW